MTEDLKRSAFPVPAAHELHPDWHGMTLLQHYAALAMPVALAHYLNANLDNGIALASAELAFEVAEAMLEVGGQ